MFICCLCFFFLVFHLSLYLVFSLSLPLSFLHCLPNLLINLSGFVRVVVNCLIFVFGYGLQILLVSSILDCYFLALVVFFAYFCQKSSRQSFQAIWP